MKILNTVDLNSFLIVIILVLFLKPKKHLDISCFDFILARTSNNLIKSTHSDLQEKMLKHK